MATILHMIEEPSKRKTAPSKLPGLSFQADPYTPPKKDYMQALEELWAKYPVRKLRKGEKGISEQLREWRDSH